MGLKDRFTAVLGDGEEQSQVQDTKLDDGFIAEYTSGDYDRRKPPKDDLEEYWRTYETNPLVRQPINHFASDVVEPGFRVKAEDDDLEKRLETWLEQGAISHGEVDKHFTDVLRQCVIQREVRGTAMIEVVPNEEGNIWGFRPINAATVYALTYDNQNILIKPDDTELKVPTNWNDEAAAYIQFDERAIGGPFDRRDEVPLSQNDVVKTVRDGDTNDIYGTSRVEEVYEYIEGLDKILEDNEKAIASKGHPHWVFKLGEPNGDPSNPRAGIWADDKIRKLRDSHKKDNFTAGQKDFLPGDVDVETISGDTADIEETISFYVEYILSAMPTPKYMLGFADEINRDITSEQEEQYNRQISNARRELESTFRQVLQAKAEEYGYSNPNVRLSIEPKRHENPLMADDFDAQEFKSFAQGLKAIAPAGSTEMVMPPEEVREKILGLEAEPDVTDEQEEMLPELADTEPEVAEAFTEMYSTGSESEELIRKTQYVKWGSRGGTAHGQVVQKRTDACFNDEIDGDIEVCPSDDDPALLIQLYQEREDGWEETETRVAHKESTVEEWEPDTIVQSDE